MSGPINPFAFHNGVNNVVGHLPSDEYRGERTITAEDAEREPSRTLQPETPHPIQETVMSTLEAPAAAAGESDRDDSDHRPTSAARQLFGSGSGAGDTPRRHTGGRAATPPETMEAIAASVKSGATYQQCVERFGVSVATVSKACRQHGVTVGRGRRSGGRRGGDGGRRSGDRAPAAPARVEPAPAETNLEQTTPDIAAPAQEPLDVILLRAQIALAENIGRLDADRALSAIASLHALRAS